MANKEKIIKETLANQDKVYKSILDNTIRLYYRKVERLYCVVVKHSSHKEGFLITAYPTDKIKEREMIWTK